MRTGGPDLCGAGGACAHSVLELPILPPELRSRSTTHGATRPKVTSAQWMIASRAMARGEGLLLPLPTAGPGAVVLGALLDRELFGTIWGPTIAAMSVVVDHADCHGPGLLVLRDAFEGFQAVARIAAANKMTAVMDHQVRTVAADGGGGSVQAHGRGYDEMSNSRSCG